jgi:hypothetical protein
MTKRTLTQLLEGALTGDGTISQATFNEIVSKRAANPHEESLLSAFRQAYQTGIITVQ